MSSADDYAYSVSDSEEEECRSIAFEDIDRKVERAKERKRLADSVKAARDAARKYEQEAAREEEIERMKAALERRIEREEKRRRKAVQPPGSNDKREQPLLVKGVKHKDVKAHSDAIFGTASRSIARFVKETMEGEGFTTMEDEADAAEVSDPVEIPEELRYEAELEMAVYPEKLVIGAWKEIKKFPDLSSAHGFKEGLSVINDKLDHVIRTQQLHSIAHLTALKAQRMTSLLCIKDGPARDEIYWQLQASLKSVVLANDPELQELPFADPESMARFFESQKRVEKLAFFLMTYIDFKKGYAKALTKSLFSPNMQRVVYWEGPTTGRG